ncbi:hypothetical protein PILCRDRAFT_830501 [Piloderma croceum F 1598]|uniref:Uncharacterized protein n=1 Tax=Piloderma croceum (strain F 1598) TaxID=765440 RepID=A0A0C3ETT0_PILCF|nr:hypothetical protein PILCRDRAFT_830501 [Piloderma croceum F 1598]
MRRSTEAKDFDSLTVISMRCWFIDKLQYFEGGYRESQHEDPPWRYVLCHFLHPISRPPDILHEAEVRERG